MDLALLTDACLFKILLIKIVIFSITLIFITFHTSFVNIYKKIKDSYVVKILVYIQNLLKTIFKQTYKVQ